MNAKDRLQRQYDELKRQAQSVTPDQRPLAERRAKGLQRQLDKANAKIEADRKKQEARQARKAAKKARSVRGRAQAKVSDALDARDARKAPKHIKVNRDAQIVKKPEKKWWQ